VEKTKAQLNERISPRKVQSKQSGKKENCSRPGAGEGHQPKKEASYEVRR